MILPVFRWVSPSPSQLSEAGFFFTGPRDKVQCFSCDASHNHWKPAEVRTFVISESEYKYQGWPFITTDTSTRPFITTDTFITWDVSGPLGETHPELPVL